MLAPRSNLNQIQLEEEIFEFGKRVFTQIGAELPNTFNKSYWAGRIMEWSMLQPGFKTDMFRLVDVMPNLRSNEAIAQHVAEYLWQHTSKLAGIGPLARWFFRGSPDGVRATVLAFLVRRSIQEMASLFIAGRDPKSAASALRKLRANSLAYTVDLLGEFSVSEEEADTYVDRYIEALESLDDESQAWGESAPLIKDHAGETSPVCISVKLTALYSQCNALNFDRSVAILSEKLARIVRKAAERGALVYVDAEDSGNNPIIYAVFRRVFGSAEFRSLPYPGIVVQAYQKNSRRVLIDLFNFAEERGAPIAVRLVKGAYWDQETIAALQNGFESPLFAHKSSTDAHFEGLTRLLIENHEAVLPAFGSHNIRSLSYACCVAADKGLTPKDFELQMLYGMAEPIARAFARYGYLVRLYVPLGDMLVGMGYLVRRLLENTSNESFLRHTFFEHDQVESLLRKPEVHPEDAPFTA